MGWVDQAPSHATTSNSLLWQRASPFDLPHQRAHPLSKLGPGPFEIHFREQSQGLGSRAAAHPDLADAVTGHPICQEELCNPGRDVSINPNKNSILTP